MGKSLGKIDLSEDALDHPFAGEGVFFIPKPPATTATKSEQQNTNHTAAVKPIVKLSGQDAIYKQDKESK